MKYLNTQEMQALERHACDKYHTTLEQMMQNAGKAVFDVVMNEVLPQVSGGEIGQSRILVVCGKGNNGGDALVTAKLLAEKGIDVVVYTPFEPDDFSEMARAELDKLAETKVVVEISDTINNLSNVKGQMSNVIVIDALFGFSLKGNPRLPEAKIIEQINYSKTPVLAVDVPSGLDVHDGSIGTPCIKADYIVALGMPKIGFKEHPEYVGKTYIGDLGIPKGAYEDMGYEPPMFRGSSYISVN